MQPIISDAVVIGVDTHKDVHVAVAQWTGVQAG